MKSNLSIIIPILLLVACKTVPKTPLEGTLAGVVYDLDKAPVGEANIKLTSGKTNLSSTTNSQGPFHLLRYPGRHVYSVILERHVRIQFLGRLGH